MPKSKGPTKQASEPWRKLTPKEVDLVMKDETTFAEYLVTLSVEQIDSYLLQLKSDTSMEKASRDSFIALLKNVRVQRSTADKHIVATLKPLVQRADNIAQLDEQIAALEKIAEEL